MCCQVLYLPMLISPGETKENAIMGETEALCLALRTLYEPLQENEAAL